MSLDPNRVHKLLSDYQRIVRPDDSRKFYLANCYVQLGEYVEAKRLYGLSCIGMITPPYLWKLSGHPDWLVDICVLSSRKDLYQDILRELNGFKLDKYSGESILALYSYGLMELLCPTGENIKEYIQGLLKKKNILYGVSLGEALLAIIENDQNGFNNALGSFLKVYEGMAKKGRLRTTA